MFKCNNQPVHSEYRYFQHQVQNNMFKPYTLQEHVTSESHQNNKKTFTFNPNSTVSDFTLTLSTFSSKYDVVTCNFDNCANSCS